MMLGVQVLLSLFLSLGLLWDAFAFDLHKKDNVSRAIVSSNGPN